MLEGEMKNLTAMMLVLALAGCLGPRWIPICDFRCLARLGDFSPAVEGSVIPKKGRTLRVDVHSIDRPCFLKITCQRDDASELFDLAQTGKNPFLPCDIRVVVSNQSSIIIMSTVTNLELCSYSTPNYISYAAMEVCFPKTGRYYFSIQNTKSIPFFASASNCVAELEWVGSTKDDFKNLIVR
jgi:hypothetical protein